MIATLLTQFAGHSLSKMERALNLVYRFPMDQLSPVVDQVISRDLTLQFGHAVIVTAMVTRLGTPGYSASTIRRVTRLRLLFWLLSV
jgi:hypothetical protein